MFPALESAHKLIDLRCISVTDLIQYNRKYQSTHLLFALVEQTISRDSVLLFYSLLRSVSFTKTTFFTPIHFNFVHRLSTATGNRIVENKLPVMFAKTRSYIIDYSPQI